ncbi:Membrane protein [Vigna angularis]|uniref:Membrane protein n=4 Tax=Vigna TaxID=3913 RepID=A0A8T0KGK8_PHAAN|nr:Membrane protein [Vigna angularis]
MRHYLYNLHSPFEVAALATFHNLLAFLFVPSNQLFSLSTYMANDQMKPIATLLLGLNFCMYVIVLGIGGWAMNRAIDHGFVIGPGFDLPAHFSPIYFPMGNAATGFFVTFALIAGVAGVGSLITGVNHVRSWTSESLPSAASVASIAWALTVLAMGFACKEIQLNVRNSRLKTMEAFMIILSATQLFYIAAIHGAASIRR